MPSPDESSRHAPEEKSKTKAENRLMENGLLAALCVAAVIAGYFVAKWVSRWVLEIG
ncbi:hypothetical protein [Polaromonas sp. YR568]|uniref:hypothetical protein n=1 Tax=Polaromonas sp. YR568 TaxID=1855301 RepID=UPI00398C15C8